MSDLIDRDFIKSLGGKCIAYRDEKTNELFPIIGIDALPSAQQKTKNRRFEEIVVTYPNPDLCSYPEYKGKPYFSIKYEENEEHYIGYGTYNPTVFSMYLKRYFMQSSQPGQNIAHKINLHQYPAAWICSECGSKHFDFSDKYCSYCGADVRESKDE